MSGQCINPPTKTAPTTQSSFDRVAARAALKAISYGDCGSLSAGKVLLTFSSDGQVAKAAVVAGEYDVATKSCLETRFQNAKVPAFTGEPVTVAWALTADSK